MAPSDDTILQFGSSASQLPAPVEARRCCPVCERRFSGDAAFCPYDGERLTASASDAEREDPRVGLTIDERYEVKAVLGEGGMGTVYLVRHVTLERQFALKAMRRELASEGEVARRFIQEAKAAAAVSHPGVVQIIDFGALPTGEPYFVMDLVRGHSLGRVIRDEGFLSPVRAAAILRQLAEALGAAHQVGVIHRDLKPENVVIGEADQVKVLDFGLAKVLGGSKLTRDGVVFGTPHYMSPEQAAGDPVDCRSDIYALGVLAFQMITGRVPFESDTYMGVMTQHMYMAPPRPSDWVPQGIGFGALEPVVMRCLAKDPSARFQGMAEVVAALEGMGVSFSGAPPMAQQQISVVPVRRTVAPSRNARGPIVATAAVAGALMVAAAVVSWRLGPRPAVIAPEPEPVSLASVATPPRSVNTAEPGSSARQVAGSPASADSGEVVARPVASARAEPSGPVSAPALESEAPAIVGEIVDPWKK